MRRSGSVRIGALALGTLVVASVAYATTTVVGDEGVPAPNQSRSSAAPTDSPNPVVVSPAVVGRTPDPRVASALFDADVSIPGVYVEAIAEADNAVRVLYHAGSNSAEKFRAFVEARTADSSVRWEDSGYSPVDQQATGRAIHDEARERGLSPSGASFNRDTFEFVVFVTAEPAIEPVFTKRHLAGREVTVRVEVSPVDGPE